MVSYIGNCCRNDRNPDRHRKQDDLKGGWETLSTLHADGHRFGRQNGAWRNASSRFPVTRFSLCSRSPNFVANLRSSKSAPFDFTLIRELISLGKREWETEVEEKRAGFHFPSCGIPLGKILLRWTLSIILQGWKGFFPLDSYRVGLQRGHPCTVKRVTELSLAISAGPIGFSQIHWISPLAGDSSLHTQRLDMDIHKFRILYSLYPSFFLRSGRERNFLFLVRRSSFSNEI